MNPKEPVWHFLKQVAAKLGFTRTMTAPGSDVVDAVNRQSDQIAELQDSDTYMVRLPSVYDRNSENPAVIKLNKKGQMIMGVIGQMKLANATGAFNVNTPIPVKFRPIADVTYRITNQNDIATNPGEIVSISISTSGYVSTYNYIAAENVNINPFPSSTFTYLVNV